MSERTTRPDPTQPMISRTVCTHQGYVARRRLDGWRRMRCEWMCGCGPSASPRLALKPPSPAAQVMFESTAHGPSPRRWCVRATGLKSGQGICRAWWRSASCSLSVLGRSLRPLRTSTTHHHGRRARFLRRWRCVTVARAALQRRSDANSTACEGGGRSPFGHKAPTRDFRLIWGVLNISSKWANVCLLDSSARR